MSIKRILILVGIFLIADALRSQTPPVTLLSAPAGSTQANCGTPTVPSVCVVGTGVFVWQNSTQGWFLLAPAAAAGVTSITVNGGPAQTGAVGLTIPSKATSITNTTIQ